MCKNRMHAFRRSEDSKYLLFSDKQNEGRRCKQKYSYFNHHGDPNGPLNRPCEADLSRPMVKKAFSRYCGGRGCYIPIIWDTGCSKSIVSEEAVRALGSQINKLDRLLKIISASGESLSFIGTEDIFITTQVMGKRKRLLQCCALRGSKQNPAILVSLEMMKKLKKADASHQPMLCPKVIRKIIKFNL